MLAACAPAAAQGRVSVSVNAAAQTGATNVDDRFDFEENAEAGRAEIRGSVRTGTVFDGGVGIRLWKDVGAGLAVSRMSRNDAARVDAAIPHPFRFGEPRDVSGELGDVTRAETGVHLQVLYTIAAPKRLRLVLSAGPSLLSVEQEVVTSVEYDEAFPFDTATFRSATTRRAKKSVASFNVGGDVVWMLRARIGVGALVRFVHGRANLTAPIEAPDGTTFTNPPSSRGLRVDAGGLQIGAGVRVHF